MIPEIVNLLGIVGIPAVTGKRQRGEEWFVNSSWPKTKTKIEVASISYYCLVPRTEELSSKS